MLKDGIIYLRNDVAMKKMLVSDYDDTFYINDDDILKNIELVDEYRNKMVFMIATGRSYFDYNNKKNKYNIKSEYVILNHGATILKNDEIIYNIEIDNKIKNELIYDLKIENSEKIFACSKKESRLNIECNNLTKIHIKYPSKEYALEIYNYILKKYSNYLNFFLVSDRTAIEIVSKQANKKNGILKIMKLEDIDKENVYTVGDGDTDYEMLSYFNGYKMENSSIKLQELELPKVRSVSELINIINK